jgi:hypothetical protein
MVNPNFVIEQMKDLDYKYFVVEDMAGNPVTHSWQVLPLDRAVERFKSFLKKLLCWFFFCGLYFQEQ